MLDLDLEGQSNLFVPGSSGSLDPISHSDLVLKEHNYLSLSECSSVDSSGVPVIPEQNKDSLNLKATELRLGLPGSQSPERDSETNLSTLVKLNEQPLFPLHPLNDESRTSHKVVVQGNKRGFSDTVDEYSGVKGSLDNDENRMFQAAGSDPEIPISLALGKGSTNITINEMLPNMSPGTQSSTTKEITTKLAHERPWNTSGIEYAKTNGSSNNTGAPDAKEQVVGWPPIRSFRKNTLAITSKNNDEVVSKRRPGALFVKVSMDGAPYLRKVDIKTYCSYQELSSSLANMFSCFTKGRCRPQGTPGKEVPTESKLQDLLNGSEYVLTYEDKDGDWMLVGDVPWEMFTDSCKRLKIMKSSDSIEIAPRATEKPKNGNFLSSRQPHKSQTII